MRLATLNALIIAVCLITPSWLSKPVAAADGPEIERRIDSLLKQMTLEEKIGQLQQLDGEWTGLARPEQFDLARRGLLGSTLNVRGARRVNELQRAAVEQSRLKIPILFGFDVIHGYRTIFPIPLGQASSWDPPSWEKAASIAALETSAAGVRWTFAPMLDIARDARWGRIAEGGGEDPYLVSAFAAAQVRGYQGNSYASPGKILGCAKHWVAYGAAEAGRDYNTTEVSERTLREIYFPPFKAAVDAGVGTFMSSFNDLNGIPATANQFTLDQVLRKEWKFDGFVVSDYDGIRELIVHGIASDEAGAAQAALSAGVDMEMVSRTYNNTLADLLKRNKISVAAIDEAVRRILRVKLRLGLFERPYADESAEQSLTLRTDSRAAARQIASRSMVLLKNEGGLLPLSKNLDAIAVIGPLADNKRDILGSWSGDGRAEDAVTPLDAIKSRIAGSTRISYAGGCDIIDSNKSNFEEATRAARESKVAIVVVGESAEMSGEAASRTSLDLPGKQLELIKAVVSTGTPTVVVLMNGRPISIGWVAENAPAILETWFAGTEGGNAIADVLFGDVNPGGKLPVTFPRSVGQVPIYYNHKNTGRPADPKDKYTSKYIDGPSTPLYPFGWGLSYTKFQLSGLTLSSRKIPSNGSLDVSVDVRNVGDRAGDEVVQLYVHDVAAAITRPVKQLSGFQRVTLQPGEQRRLTFSLGPSQLGFYNRDMRFEVEPGVFKVMIGPNSLEGLEASFEVDKE